ncbi:hypothetical protein BC827DRAFT_1156329 [Russula dissimulans]|nr:hypothetical protein BC827DRAFT_1156329 [Russula dissimulans]
MYHHPFSIPLASLLFFQAAASEWPACTTATSTAASPSDERPSPPPRYFDSAARLSSVLIATSGTPRDMHQRVGVIVGACLGAAGGVLLLGLAFFWILLRHRHHTATAHTQDVVPRSWLPSDLLGSSSHGVVAVANHPSLSLDLAGADDADNVSVMPVSEETAEMKRWNKSTDVLDISVENVPRSPPLPPTPTPPPRSPSLPEPIEPYVPSQVSHCSCAPSLSIHTDVKAEGSSSSPPSSLEGSTPPGASRSSPLRPLPTPPSRTRSQTQMRRPPSSTKAAEGARRESRPSRLSRVVSVDDLQSYVHEVHHDDRRSVARSVSSISCEAVGCEIVQHHDGGVDVEARIDLPPPYYECLRVRATHPSTSSQAVAFPDGSSRVS